MIPCPACHDGTLEEELTETWMKREQRWILFTSVPGMVCNVCGEKVFSQGVAEQLAQLLDPSRHEIPTSSLWCPVYDLVVLKRAKAQGERPISVLETGLPNTIFTPPVPDVDKVNTFVRVDVYP